MADPLSLGVASAAIAMMAGFNKQQPTTQTVSTADGSVPDQRRIQQLTKIIVSTPQLHAFSGMNSDNKPMLEDERPIKSAPKNFKDNPRFKRWFLANKPKIKTFLQAYPIRQTNKSGVLQHIYERMYLPKYGAATRATFQHYLDGQLARTKVDLQDMLNNRSGFEYSTSVEIQPVMVRKSNKAGRFMAGPNYVDDTPFCTAQRGMSTDYPPYTRSGASEHYHLKQNAAEGPYYAPYRMAPTRYERPGNVATPTDLPRMRVPASAFAI